MDSEIVDIGNRNRLESIRGQNPVHRITIRNIAQMADMDFFVRIGIRIFDHDFSPETAFIFAVLILRISDLLDYHFS